LKPAVKTRPHHRGGGSSQFNQLIINWYQQTWHTIEFSNNRHTRHHHQHFTAVDRSGATFQTYPVSASFANQRFRDFLLPQTSPAQMRHAAKRTIFQAVEQRGFVAIFPHQRRRLRKQYTPRTHTANPPPTTPPHPKNPATTPNLHHSKAAKPSHTQTHALFTGSHPHQAQDQHSA
jgi:hypothetical protein